jgi:hypothetical protein
MDVYLLKRYDKAQDIDALYREILRNVGDKGWYWHTCYNKWQCIDYLDMNNTIEEYIICNTNDDKWLVEKWINLT